MNYDFEYEVQGAATFLVYQKKAEDNIDSMSMGMVSNNKIDGIIPFIYTQVEEQVYFKYNVSAKNTLQQYFSGVVTKKSFLGVLDSLVDAFIQAEEYMLEMSSIVLDTEYIFVNPITSEAFVVVLPIKRENTETLESFVRLLLFSVQFDRTEDCAYIAELINFLNSNQFFSLSDFKKLLNHMQNGNGRIQNRAVVPEKQNVIVTPVVPEKVAVTVIPSEIPKQVDKTPERSVSAEESSVRKNEETAIPGVSNTSEKNEKVPKNKKIFGKKGEQFKMPEPPPFQGNFSSGIEAKAPVAPKKPEIPKKGLSEKADKKSKKRIAIPGKDLRKEKTQEREGISGTGAAMQQQKISGENYQVASQDFGKTVDLSSYQNGTTVLAGNNPGGTTVLINPKKQFFLYRKKTGEEFEILKNRTKIGRDASSNDIYLAGNSAISGEHAVFINQADSVYIMDSQSTNGTFVNGLQLKAGSVSEALQNGISIRLADEEFEFRIRN